MAAAHQVVSVARTIDITRGSDDPNRARPYDCAVEEAGCVLAVGPYQLPARAVLVPISFLDVPLEDPTVSIVPATDLGDGEQVTVAADGLRPNTTFGIALCQRAPGVMCDELFWPSATSDADGTFTAEVTVRAAIYGWQGRVDCTAEPCAVVVTDEGKRLAEAPFQFAPGTEAPVPELRLDPPGPFVDGQTVTVHGTGFPPGFGIGRQLGQCPADKDTAVEHLCGYQLGVAEVVVAADGTFDASFRVSDELAFTGTCVTGPGCLLAWVLNHGPIATSVPLTFTP